MEVQSFEGSCSCRLALSVSHIRGVARNFFDPLIQLVAFDDKGEFLLF